MSDNDDIIPIDGENLPQQPKQPSLQDYIDKFLNEHDVKPASRERYRKSLKVFSEWINNNNVQSITKKELKDYKEHLCSEKSDLSNLTISAYLAAVKVFFSYMYEEDIIARDIAKKLEGPERQKTHQRKALTKEECIKLLQQYKDSPRDYAMVNLMMRNGLRTIEITRIRIEDIVVGRDGRKILYVHGKGRTDKSDFTQLSDKAFDPIKTYLETRPNWSPHDYLFVSGSKNNMGKGITTKTVSDIVRVGMRAIGLPEDEYTAHSLRNTAGSMMIEAGAPIERVQAVLRHRHLETTMGYVADAERQKHIEAFPESLIDNFF